MAEKTIKQQQTLNDLLQDSLGQREETVKTLRDQLNLEKELANLVRGSKDLSKKQLDVVGDVLDKSKDILDNQKEIAEETFNTVELEKLERKLINEGLGDRTQIIEKLKAQQRIQKQTNNLINAQASVYEKIGGSVDGLVRNIPIFGDFLSDALGTGGLGKSMAEGFRTRASEGGFFKDAGAEFFGGFGVSLFQGGNISQTRSALAGFLTNISLVATAAAAGVFIASVRDGLQSLTVRDRLKKLFFGSTFEAFKDAFGRIDRLNLGNVLRTRFQRTLFGTQTADVAKLLQLQTEITGLSDKQAFNIQTQINRFAVLRGVLPKDIIADIAQNTELFAKFAKDGGQNLGEAAVRAKELGLSLSTVSSISDTLLDFQSSIEAELKASLLIGRQLNLNRARELALAGDQAGLLNEIVSLVGSEAELNRMNAIERQALAEAIGVSVAELNRLASGDVEFGSSDIKENTQAVKNLTKFLQFAALGGGGRVLAGAAPGMAEAILRGANRSEVKRMEAAGLTRGQQTARLVSSRAGGLGTARFIGRTALFGGQAIAVVSAIAGLTFLVKGIVDLFKKNNSTQEIMARRSVTQAQNFPVFSSEVLSGN